MKTKSLLTGRPAGQSHLYSPTLRKNVLRVLSILVVIWGELGAFYWSLRECRWPTFKSTKKGGGNKPAHVLLLSDTQVMHPLLQSRGEAWTTVARRFFYDLNLKKSWHVTSRLNPDTVIFLGDMLSNGKQAKSSRSYAAAVEKFKRTFRTKPGVATYYVPGNNDISMGQVTPMAKRVRSYFADSFGPLSQRFDVQNHTFVALDAPGLVDEDYQRAGRGISFSKWKPIPDGPIAFVNEIASKIREEEDKPQKPLILLSHIPLARPEMANCGPLREKGTIRRDVGHGYQSILGRQTTTFLFKTLQPVSVFSGDNRDYCEFIHTNLDDAHSIREVTLKSFSMSVHIRHPGFQLLSIMDPDLRDASNQNTIADTPCFLPNQSKIYTSFYAPLFVLTFLALFLINYSGSRRSKGKGYHRSLAPIRVGSSSTSSSEQSSPVRSKGPGHNVNPLIAIPWTPTWSPYSPNTPLSPRGGGGSNNLPGVLRTPHSAKAFSGPSYRASSRPGTPGLGASLVVPESPFAYSGGAMGDDEDEDPMLPSQYSVMKRETGQRKHDDHDEEWSEVGHGGRSSSSLNTRDEEDYDLVNSGLSDSGSQDASLPIAKSTSAGKHRRAFSQFISAPDSSKRGLLNTERGWSWSFVLGGRRRRITLKTPNIAGMKNLIDLFQGSGVNELHKRHQGVWVSTLVDMFSISWPGALTWWFIVWTLS